PLRMALVLAAIGIGLRGSVAALWGYAQASDALRIPKRLNLPPHWHMADMERLDPQDDYSAMRKRLLDGDWPALRKASPWQWMLALIGLLNAGLPQAFDGLPDLKQIYHALAQWQTAPADGVHGKDGAEEEDQTWPFEALPSLAPQGCDELMAALPKALCALDDLRGMRVVYEQGQKFGRRQHTDEFTDASGASWPMSTPQFTSLYSETLPQRSVGRRMLKWWYETRGVADDELLAVHTLDNKLGNWFWHEKPLDTPTPHREPSSVAVQQNRAAKEDEASPANLAPGEFDEPAQGDQASTLPTPTQSNAVRVKRLKEWQYDLWSKRFAVGKTNSDEELTAHSHLRVALFQWRVDDSYSHPIAEVGLGGFPLAPATQKALQAHLDGDLKAVDKAAKRGAEFQWRDDRKIISWPEHRRRVLLGQALYACKELKVQLLVLPEISVRPDTLEWLKGELIQHPGLAVLAGTFRQFEGITNHPDHLKEKLTLLWHPAKAEANAFGLQGAARVMQFQRDKKYRAVAAHEFFRPSGEKLAPLYQEERVLDKWRDTWTGAPPTFDQIKTLMQALIHGPQKLRYCMELICSELFLLTSPANRQPLLQDLAKMLRQFGEDDATKAKKSVDEDIKALGEWLTITQANRERRSVLLVPACTSRSNDYWHAGQASVLASGTATVFCNAVSKGLSVGGSCFIGCESVQKLPKEHPGIVRLPTPYHGWHHGILQPSGLGALSEADQALVVVDLDPVHMVSGKPRPQLLPEPMSLVAYLPIVEVVRKEENARTFTTTLCSQPIEEEGRKTLEHLTQALAAPCEALHNLTDFEEALAELLKARRNGCLTAESGGPALDAFVGFFGDRESVRQRILTSLQDRYQQPAPSTKVVDLELTPAWLDFLVADLTWKHRNGEMPGDKQPAIRVPPWQPVPNHSDAGVGGSSGGDATAV
ncbi:MAG: hypothetical protein ORN29_04790, partial [Rhodoferax sp.]|nr:hypothetical protein [Rhodoferax sp.]